jgi:alkylation response protein AidB-like acyl-CoA dehydrogenase
MRLELTPDQQALRKEVRDYFAAMMTPEVEEEMARGEMGGPLSQRLARRMGADGWLGIGWPEEYGGQNRSPVEQLIFFDEASRAGAPVRCSRSTPSGRRSCVSAPKSSADGSCPGSSPGS